MIITETALACVERELFMDLGKSGNDNDNGNDDAGVLRGMVSQRRVSISQK